MAESTLRALRSILLELSRCADFDAVAGILRERARGLVVGADGIALAMKRGDQVCYVAEDAIAPLWTGQCFPAVSCASGRAMRTGSPVVIEEVTDDPDLPRESYADTFVRSLAMVPLRGPDPIGALGAYWATPHRATEEELELLQALADAATVAATNARLTLELRQSEERLRAALDSAALGTWEFDAGAAALSLDARSRELLGLTGPVSVEALLERAAPEDGERVRAWWSDAVRATDLALRSVELRVGPADDRRWVALHASPRLDGGEGRPGLVGTVADVTARREQEQRSAERHRINEVLLRVGVAFTSELQHERLVQVITDEATRLSGAEFGAYFETSTNESGESFLLYTLSGAPREAFSKFPAPRNTAIFGPTFRGEGIVRIADVTKDPRYGQNPPYRGMPEGHLPVRSYLAVPVRSRTGEVLGGLFFGHSAVGVFSETHERLLAGLAGQAAVALDNSLLYRALRDSERQFRDLADAMPQIVWTARPDGYTDYFNRRWYELTGAPEGIGGDEGWKPALHPDDVQRCLDRWYESVRTGEPYEIEYRYRDHRTGQHRWHLGRAVPVRDDQGRIVRWYGTSTDIHEQKEAIRARDVFLSIASHELKTPLTPLVLQLQSLERQVERRPDASIPAQRLAEKLRAAERQVASISRLVNTLLDVSRLTERRLQANLEELDLVALVREVIERTCGERATRGAAPRIELGGDAAVVGRFDRFRVDQVVSNLLSNAAKYGRGQPIDVVVTSDERAVRIQVRDHGIGIAPEDQARIFERLERAVSSDHYGGFGLGLWICREVMEAMGGSITVESAPGAGSTFTASLPPAAPAGNTPASGDTSARDGQ